VIASSEFNLVEDRGIPGMEVVMALIVMTILAITVFHTR
jgi:Tfp pilus assembly protein PilX